MIRVTTFREPIPTPQEEVLLYPVEELRRVLEEPLVIGISDYKSNRIAPPVPLDPDNMFVRDHLDPYGDSTNLRTFRQHALESTATQFSIAELASSEFPPAFIGLLHQEMEHQINNRSDHNTGALARLKQACAERPPTDDLMHSIIARARTGTATLPEMVRLLKEYPEMISIGTSDCRDALDQSTLIRAEEDALHMAPYLSRNFNDAEVTLRGESSCKDSELAPGVQVNKRVLADIRSRDSHLQLILKTPVLRHGLREFRFGVSTYLRVADRKQRPGYQHEEIDFTFIENLPPEQARRVLGALAGGASIHEFATFR